MQPTRMLHDALLAGGWIKTAASAPGAYERHGERYLTWRQEGVLIATSSTSKVFDPERSVVLNCFGDGAEVTIEALVTEPDFRGLGAARRALSAWARLASESGTTFYIEPVPQEDGIDRARLIAFYRSLGFEPCDLGSHVMKLQPQHEH